MTKKIQRYTIFFIAVNALHVSGVLSAHHQELKTVHTASGMCTVLNFELPMMGGGNARMMQSTDSNEEYCIALHLVGHTWKNNLLSFLL
jgi:hypothetical protein